MKKLEIICRKSEGDSHQIIFKYDGAERKTIEELLAKYNVKEYVANGDGNYFFNINSGQGMSDFAKDAWFGRAPIDSGNIKLARNSYCRLRGAVDQKRFPDEVEGAGLSNYDPAVKQGELRTISGVLQTNETISKEKPKIETLNPIEKESKLEKQVDRTAEEIKINEKESKDDVEKQEGLKTLQDSNKLSQEEPKMEYKKPSKTNKFFKGVFYTALVASIGAGGYFMNEGYKQMKTVEKELGNVQEKLGKISYLTKEQSEKDYLKDLL